MFSSFFIFTFFSSFLPFLYLVPYHKQISIIFLTVFSILNISNHDLSTNEKHILRLTNILIIYSLFSSYIFGFYWLGNRYLELISSYSIIFFAIGYRRSKFFNEKFIKFLMLITEILSLFVLTITINELNVNSIIIRSIISQNEEAVNFLSRGISGYNFFYFSILYTILNFSLLLNKRFISFKLNFFEILVKFIYIILVFIMVLQANLLTGIFILIFGSFLSLALRIFSNNIIITLFSILISFIVIVSVLLPTNFFNDLILTFQFDPFTTRRLMELLSSLKILDIPSLFLSRDYVLEISIINIQQYFFFGSLLNNNLLINGTIVGFGQHSFILDSFAIFGFLFFLLLFTLLFRIIRGIVLISKKNKFVLLPLILCYVVLVTINNLTPSFNFILLFFLPLIIKKTNHRNRFSLFYSHPNLIG